jgi:hypothetical protein
MEAQILRCPSCKETHASEYQDITYGLKMRVHNPCRKGQKVGDYMWRCTVCSAERAKPTTVVEKVLKKGEKKVKE